MEKPSETVLSKIRKLLIMAEKATVHEREVAFFKAQELLARFHLDVKDVIDIDKEKVVQITAHKVSVRALLYYAMADVIAKNFRCKLCIAQRGPRVHPLFVGLETDAIVASEICTSALQYAKKEANRVAHYYYNLTGQFAGYKAEWLNGFLKGLDDGFKAQVVSSSITALMVIIPPEVDEHFNNMTFTKKASKLTTHNRNYDRDVNRAGYTNGFDFANNRKQKALEE